MRRYAISKVRILLLLGMVVFAFVASTGSFGQDAPPAGDAAPAAPAADPAPVTDTSAPPQGKGLFSLIWGHKDFVFITIALLSIIGLTLIIQGFIKNRASVMMPESTTNQIREMIEQRRFKELIEFTENDPSFISRALNPALKRAPSFNAMKEAME